ncbi:MAG: exodeoxyribonuclease III [Vicinamibacteria bacterium]
MKIATWNVNSVRARLARLLRWLEANQPDVLCLQELKVEDEAFPLLDVQALGYHAALHGQRTYNGVAILSKEQPQQVERGMAGALGPEAEDGQARLISAMVAGVCVASAYFPNGGELGSDKWEYKLAWMKRLRSWLDARCDANEPLALCGDFNVAPDARDVHDPAAWEGSVLYHPDVRAALAQVRAFGLHDSLRLVTPEAGLYSWWDYRMLGFPKNRGLRIDHVDVTAPLAARVARVVIDRNERKGQQPSDHAPVVVELR